MNKKRAAQLEDLLDWEREGDRLPKTVELFNRQISETMTLQEVMPKLWKITTHRVDDNGVLHNNEIYIKHTSLIQLGLSILEGVKFTSDRFINGGD